MASAQQECCSIQMKLFGCTQCAMIWPWSGEGKQLWWIYTIKWLQNLHSPYCSVDIVKQNI
ncbi:hypothetical protein K439DRAFT_769736 [Ramaria rubella]|nr:hypothetical protein K439DRAFT_769736 [Ramaria rubella]